MRVTLTGEQVQELEVLIEQTLRDMSHEIAATENPQFRIGLVARRQVFEEVLGLLRSSTVRSTNLGNARTSDDSDGTKVWSVDLLLTEDGDRTRADARMRAANRDWHGWGRARRNPTDPDVPAIGEELATARALVDLSHQLLETAAGALEAFEGRPVHLNR